MHTAFEQDMENGLQPPLRLAVPGASKIMLAGTKTHKLNIDIRFAEYLTGVLDIDIVPFRPNSVPAVTATSSGSAALTLAGGA